METIDNKGHELIDVVECGKLRVVVAQMDEGVDEEQVENAVATFAESLNGARCSVHTIPLDAGARYTSRVNFILERVERAPSESDASDETET